MQPVNSSIHEKGSAPLQKKSSGQGSGNVIKTERGQTGNPVKVPQDTVKLSAYQAVPQNNMESRKPSTPVTNEEKMALIDSFFGETGFSVYS